MYHRALDEMIAERFFGLCLHKNTETLTYFVPVISDNQTDLKCLSCGIITSQHHAIQEGWGNALPYSTDMNHAWQVLNKLRDSGKYCCLDLSSDYNYIYDFDLKLSELEGNLNHKTTVHTNGRDPAVLICIIALMSIGMEKEEIYNLIGE